ncbi:elongator complex protein 1 [Phalaenopsis equestris]|uniref:elongator complex protein 1 n=1 Tax=Phalaenopsis equestris TaxID=78828 RepID=UPI0009E47F52|nr:elongator complex protein 1 [Phalaenopsis equestris]
MKNLKLYSFPSFDLDLQSEEETLLLSAFDIERNRLFFASSANIIYAFELPSSQAWNKSLLSPQFSSVTLDPGDFITAMDYLMEKEALVLGTSDGSLILHTMDDSTTELVGRVEGGVKHIACSPDGALLAITSGIGQLLVMTQDWEVLHESALNLKNDAIGDVDGYPSHFHAPISWRGDGKYFATLGGLHECYSKKLRIWERESGILHSESEPKAFVGEALDWMPSGAKITMAYDCKIATKPLIVFFEKNGLERNSLCMDEPAEISIVKWNCSSDLLATSAKCSQHDAIKIWFFSNNHWYLKQEIRHSKSEGVKFMWNPTKPTNLIIWTVGGTITSYNFVWITAVTENSTALVVDGSRLLVSPLNLSLVPPPMSLFILKFPASIQDVAFLHNSSKNHLAASLSDGSLGVMELPRIDSWARFEDEEFVIETARLDLKFRTFAQIMWLDSHLLLGVTRNPCDSLSKSSRDESELIHQNLNCSAYSLLEFEVVCSVDSIPELLNSSGWHANLSKSSPLEGVVVSIVSNPCKKASAFVQMEGGTIFDYTSGFSLRRGSRFGEPDPEHGFSASCPWMKAVQVCDNGDAKPLLLGLDYDGKLRVGKRVLCSNCSSFTLYSSGCGGAEQSTHLFLTTKQDFLFIVSIDDILQGNKEIKIESLKDLPNRRDKDKDFINIWEKGAKLIGALHGEEAAIILQAHRGSLECIYPRKLVLLSILNALQQRRFKEALAMVRRHRIDFNFIIDCFGWQRFIKSAAEFVKQVDNLAYVTEFVSSIKGGNVMDSLYKDYNCPSITDETSNVSMESSNFIEEGKVNSVLRAIRKALEEQVRGSPARELCILTTLARNEPPALEEALNRIKSIREMEVLGVNDAERSSFPSAEESLKHLLWLADSEAVFEAALGLYDINLAAIVALNSQKDPKEFLPYLKELENSPPVVMRYSIDLRLRRYESALKHMFSAGEDHYEDCLNLMKQNPQLFSLGLQLFAKSAHRTEVIEAWGDHLYDEKCFQDAASAYLCSYSHHKALKAYRGAGDWKGVLTVASLMGLNKGDVCQLANELCEEFQALGKPVEAARIVLEYCNDVGRCVGYYIMAREWEEALRISRMDESEDFASRVEDAALECASSLMSDYKEALEKLGKYLARYLAVRQRRLLLSAKVQSEGRLTENTDYDTVSEISSSFSEMSAYTTRTAKNSVTSTASTNITKSRCKANKRGKIRAGSPGEEMALIEHLKAMALTDDALRQLKSLLSALLMLGKEEIARPLQSSGYNFQLSQYSAVKLAEDVMATDRIDDRTQTLEHYIEQRRESWLSEARSWQFKVLAPLSR